MNFFKYKTPKEEWIGGANEPLKGFKWRGGTERETTGIMMWPEPFLFTRPNGENIAILLMDTQGAFDGESTNKIFTAIFAISTMISSIQIYSLSQNIQEDDLQNLQMFLEYAKIGAKTENGPPFQKLVYLVRDWSSPYEAAFGFEGGAILLQKKLEVRPEQPEELQSIRKDLKTSFANVDCFLMVHPGFEAVEKQTFEGRSSELRPEFKNCLIELIPALLSSDKLDCKKVNGLDLNVSHLPQFLKNYVELLNSSSLAEATTIFEVKV